MDGRGVGIGALLEAGDRVGVGAGHASRADAAICPASHNSIGADEELAIDCGARNRNVAARAIAGAARRAFTVGIDPFDAVDRRAPVLPAQGQAGAIPDARTRIRQAMESR